MRLPRLPLVLALLAATASFAGTPDPLARFGNRAWWTGQSSGDTAVVASSRLDLFAVRVAAADAPAVATLVEQVAVKIPGLEASLVDVWVLTQGLYAVQFTSALSPAQAALLARGIALVDGHVWPALGRGPVNDDGVPAGRAFSDDELIVTAVPGKLDDVLAKIAATVDGTDVRRLRTPNSATIRVGAAVEFDAVTAAARLHGMSDVVSVEPNLHREIKPLAITPNDPLFGRQWHLGGPRLDAAGETVPGVGEVFADDAWETTRGNPNVVISVFDSGTDYEHPDLVENVRRDLMFDASGNDDDPSPECESSQDGNSVSCPSSTPYRESHGTSVSGTIAARGDNNLGVSGVCPECSIAPVRLLGDDSSSSTLISDAFTRACDPAGDGSGTGAWAINNSWGPGFSLFFPLSRVERDAFDLCRTVGRGGKGTVILFATGNESSDVVTDAYAKHPYVIGVAASTNLDDWAYYSNYGAEVDVAAPSLGGVVNEDNFGIVCTDVRGEEGYSVSGSDDGVGIDYNPAFSGTSAATPVASGVVGLMLSVNPDLSAEQVRLVLTRSADKILADKVPWLDVFGQDLAAAFAYDETGHSIAFGYGRVNAASAVALAGSPELLGVAGSRCESTADCAGCVDGVCLQTCTTQADCFDGSVCDTTSGVCELPLERAGSFLSECTADCEYCLGTLDTRFEPTELCTVTCETDEDCEPSCADGECDVSRFDCRPVTTDPNGVKVCAVGDPNAGGPADFNACFNEQFFVSIQTQSAEGKELCSDICFDEGPAGCAYGFHCASNVDCTCTRDSNFGCREYTCFENSNGSGDGFFGFPVCVANVGHADECDLDADCQRGDYCADNGRCRFDDRAGCEVCNVCETSDDCAGRGTCLGGVCTVACDDGETCPGDSVCRTVDVEVNGRVRTQQACLGGLATEFEGATVADYCADYTCTVACRDDVPCADGNVCSAGECVPAPAEGEGEGEGEDDVLGGGGVRWGCGATGAGSAAPLFGLLVLLRRRRR